MNTTLRLLLDCFLNPTPVSPRKILKVLGGVVMVIGLGIGIFFLFEALIPLIGYVESGITISILLMLIGSFLFFINKKHEPSPRTDIVQHSHKILKNMNVAELITNSPLKIIAFAFGVGVILSQVKNIKDIKEVLDPLKLLK
ncbi:MAG: hypothetical protein K2P93_00795 [Alphaproteobacteria bacterium]|nr:hypothetical protein [Alphaproteobacteria bacterium]